MASLGRIIWVNGLSRMDQGPQAPRTTSGPEGDDTVPSRKTHGRSVFHLLRIMTTDILSNTPFLLLIPDS